MNRKILIDEIVATYQKHGWQLRRLLLLPETRTEVINQDEIAFAGVRVDEGQVDALWFSRPSSDRREAWELRLIAETPYALFETFEVDGPEEVHEEVRQEMEARMSEFTTKKYPIPSPSESN